MNIEVLQYLERDGRDHVEELVSKTKYDSESTFGVIRDLIGNGGKAGELTEKQRYHFDNFVQPLLVNVPCEGIFGPETCTGDGTIDDESLLLSYLEDDFKCQLCRYDAEKQR